MAKWKPETVEERRQRLLDDRPKAWADYHSEREAIQDRTARLRELRLAREVAESVIALPAHKIKTPKKMSSAKAKRPFVQGNG
jgi:hypothetical protein